MGLLCTCQRDNATLHSLTTNARRAATSIAQAPDFMAFFGHSSNCLNLHPLACQHKQGMHKRMRVCVCLMMATAEIAAATRLMMATAYVPSHDAHTSRRRAPRARM
eukprot:918144-Pelagomonas_calceolata.AAC.1